MSESDKEKRDRVRKKYLSMIRFPFPPPKNPNNKRKPTYQDDLNEILGIINKNSWMAWVAFLAILLLYVDNIVHCGCSRFGV